MFVLKTNRSGTDDCDTFQVDLFEDKKYATKHLRDSFLDVVEEREFDKEDKEVILDDFTKHGAVAIEQERFGFDTDVRYEPGDFFELICDDSGLKVYCTIEEVRYKPKTNGMVSDQCDFPDLLY